MRLGSTLRRPSAGGARARFLLGLAVGLGLGLGATAADGPPRAIGQPIEFSERYPTGTRYMGIRLLGAVVLRPVHEGGLDLGGLSGLAWDDDEGLLYAVSDRGAVFSLRPRFDGERLSGADLVAAHALRDARGERLSGADGDAEGLEIIGGRDGQRGNARLVIAFERRPRVAEYTVQGRLVGLRELPPALRDVRRYAGRNKALEAVTRHPQLGWLTAPEWPLRGEEDIGVFGLPEGGAAPGAGAVRLSYPRFPARDSALVAIEALPDGSLLTLDRSFHRATLSLTVALRRTQPLNAGDRRARLLPAELAVFDSFGDWAIDNFEGLARHRERRVFIVSDDNLSFLQRTVLLYLELVEPE